MAVNLDYTGALRRNWQVLVTVFVVTLLVAVIATAMQTPVYESSAQLIVSPTSGEMDTSDVIRAVETLERRTVVATFARMPSSPEVEASIAREMRLDETQIEQLSVTGSVVPNTNIIRIDARGNDAKMTADAANRAADMTARQAAALYRVYELRFLTRATAPKQPVHPSRKRNLLVGAVVGAALGLAAALAAERLRSAGGDAP